MKSNLGILATGMLVVASAAAGPNPASMAKGSDAKHAVLALEDQWVQAEIHRDEAVLQRILDSRFVVTFGSGKTVDKATFIEGIVADKGTILSQELTDRIVLVEDNTVVVVETDTARGKNADGEPWTAVLRITTTYVKRDGRWVALAEQMVSVKPPKGGGG
jgi:ketosteroid isomerase-like protein